MFESAVVTFMSANSTILFNTGEMVSDASLLIMGVFGLLGSGAILFSSAFYHQSPHSMIILSLCVGDFISCVNVMVATTVNLARGGLLSGHSGLVKCMAESFFELISISVLITSLTLIAGERYFAVFYGMLDHNRPVIFAILSI
jgi:hypothetical protein